MITNTIISLVVTIVTFFDGLLPHLTPPTWFTSDGVGGTVAGYVGSALGVVQPILPVDAMVTSLQAIFIILPVFAAYTVFQWVWDHVPTIAGFGTGNG